MEVESVVGGAAAVLTTAANFPQLKKCWETQSAGDLSRKMLISLSSGVALWIAYGVLKQDWLIIGANVVSLAMLLGILWFRLGEDAKG